MADDILIAQTIAERTKLAPGMYTITAPIQLGPSQILQGSGQDTFIVTDSPELIMVNITGYSTSIRDLHIGQWDWPMRMSVGIAVGGLIDRTLLENVWVDGRYSTAALTISGGAASSSIRHCAFWNYEPERFTTIIDQASDWSQFQVEHHQQSPQTTSAVIWITNSSAIRFFGGNISFRVGNGCPGYINQDNVNYMSYPPGPNLWYGTTLYQEP